jgi:hypothetical protein
VRPERVVTTAGRKTWRDARRLIDDRNMEPPAGKWTRELSHCATTVEPTQAIREGGPHRSGARPDGNLVVKRRKMVCSRKGCRGKAPQLHRPKGSMRNEF